MTGWYVRKCMACKRFVGSIPIASTQLTRSFTRSTGRRRLRKLAPCAIRARSVRKGSGSQSSFDVVGSNGHHRSNAVPVMAVERLRIVAEEIGDFLDRCASIEKKRDCAVAQQVGDDAHRLDPGILRYPGEDLAPRWPDQKVCRSLSRRPGRVPATARRQPGARRPASCGGPEAQYATPVGGRPRSGRRSSA